MKNVFITGGSSGIGLALAKDYVKEGYRVGICGRDPNKFKNINGITFYEANVTDRENLRQSIIDFAEKGLDILIANAGISAIEKTRIPDFEKARKIIDVNLIGLLNTFEIGVELFKKNGGHLVAISSVSGFVGLPGTAAYCSSKAAVLKLCESFAIDFRPIGIHVTAIAPGFVDTPLTKLNKHPMPFIISSSKTSKLIRNAISKKKELYVFPFGMYLMITILAYMPRMLYRMLMRSISFYK
ncbi:MAG: hypothetical protein CMD96_07005 [Gammaproteobacteria bacterium]|jgi:NAD(P)-dependent dehydrogenase (short-subunit alcohol dehydrogenase family)|nr:hypothetical protein [Gammaproteobacteria bacterium]HJP17134.1 SDR family NAD(P)-dependent oxidoreductase [Nitrospinota bacterium]|tara:strand:- start:30097 stop:30819 length:723 start_codon:yes stop_codon:yes gene_type:complete